MIQQLFKMIWKRKRAASLIIAEIMVCFLVIFVVTSFAIHYWDLSRQPLGFKYENMWQINFDTGGEWDSEHTKIIDDLIRAAREFPQVVDLAPLSVPPFRGSTWTSTVFYDGMTHDAIHNSTSDGFADLVGLEIIEGRWFGPQDNGQSYIPVVINQRLKDLLFANESPLGKNIADNESDERRVVGVIKEFRQHGEMRPLATYAFRRVRTDMPSDLFLRGLAVKVKPGTSVQFEEELLNSFDAIAKTWRFTATPWHESRQSQMNRVRIPILIMITIAGFLMLMVAMGLFGVLWQSITQRRQELGVRRAFGATSKHIHLQITGELWVKACLGMGIGLLIAIQAPLLGLFGFIQLTVYAKSMLVSILFVLTLVTLCAWYPSWMATKIEPAEALHYE